MKKLYLFLCLLIVGIGTLMITPMNINAAQCYYCSKNATYNWTDNGDGCVLKSNITTKEACDKKNIATGSDFIGNLSCGGTDFKFHKSLPIFTSTMFNLLKVATPVIIIITGMLDLLKAVSAQKEDEIKKSQQKLIRRIGAGAVAFLIFVIVETVINIAAEQDDAANAMDCVNCFLNGAENCQQGTNSNKWKQENGKWYAYSSSGSMLKGWQQLDWSKGNNWFYFDKTNGYMLTGWQQLDWSGGNNWFYFDPTDGYLIQDKCLNIDNKNYCFDKDGVWQE